MKWTLSVRKIHAFYSFPNEYVRLSSGVNNENSIMLLTICVTKSDAAIVIQLTTGCNNDVSLC